MVLYAFLRLTFTLLDEVKEDRASSNEKKGREKKMKLNAEVIDWFLAIDLMHVQ